MRPAGAPMVVSTEDAALPSWTQGLVSIVVDQMGLPVVAYSALAFFIYWVVPMIFAMASGVAADAAAIVAIAQQLGVPGPLAEAIATRGPATPAPHFLYYLTDQTHLLFAIVLSFGLACTVRTLRLVPQSIATLIKNGVLVSETLVEVDYFSDLRSAYAWWKYAISAVIGAVAAGIAMTLVFGPDTRGWWGNIAYGPAGLAFSVFVGLMVFGLVMGTFVLVSIARLLIRVAKLPIKLRPFHPDGCGGMSAIGQQVLWLWSCVFFGVMAIYVTLKLGYLGL